MCTQHSRSNPSGNLKNGARARAAGLRSIALRSAAAFAVLTVAGCAAYPYNTYGTYDSSYYGGAVDNGYYYAPYGPATVYDNGPIYYGPGYGGWYGGDRGYWRDDDRDRGHGSWGDHGRPPQNPRPMPGHRPPGGGPPGARSPAPAAAAAPAPAPSAAPAPAPSGARGGNGGGGGSGGGGGGTRRGPQWGQGGGWH